MGTWRQSYRSAVLALLLSVLWVASGVLSSSTKLRPQQSTSLSASRDERLLLVVTLSGKLYAMDRATGSVRWTLEDEPIVQVPIDTKDAIVPIFLPDPRDGSLYLVGDKEQPLKKLPFTLPQLVANSPCRSSDGIFYTGKKKDLWFQLDPNTGVKDQLAGDNSAAFVTPQESCPVPSSRSRLIYYGRTMYSVRMTDSRKPGRTWNVTYYRYAADEMTKDQLSNYDMVHFATSSTGTLATMKRRSGHLLWTAELSSPVVAAYLLDPDGLVMVPFSTLANHTLAALRDKLDVYDPNAQNTLEPVPQYKMKLYPALYVGDHLHGLYAMSSLIDQDVVTISPSDTVGPLLLLNGPEGLHKIEENWSTENHRPVPGYNYQMPEEFYDVTGSFGGAMPEWWSQNGASKVMVQLGHYDIPPYSETRFFLPSTASYASGAAPYAGSINRLRTTSMHLLTDESEEYSNGATPCVQSVESDAIDTTKEPPQRHMLLPVAVDHGLNGKGRLAGEQFSNNTGHSAPTNEIAEGYWTVMRIWMQKQENRGLMLMIMVLIGCVVAMFWYLQMQVRQFSSGQWTVQNDSARSNTSNTSTASSGSATAHSEELPNGSVRVGKITFHPDQLLGKGCEGTFVYRGEFDSRPVAVKRLLPDSFTFADREVALLRESDAHPNVIRYYCTEQDRMFRYIALELCQATILDYVQKRIDQSVISELEILRQATCGLAYLHSLDIVHRDIKPQNVLLSWSPHRSAVVMISDFGMCKKLQTGRVSFSRRSGVTGTEGWMAPEIVDDAGRQTCAVDLFSLGCLFYFVLSGGQHPFGDSFRRQVNIVNGEFHLGGLQPSKNWRSQLHHSLIRALIDEQPAVRPPCRVVLAHPMFWSMARILDFFQDVSDRIEKSDYQDDVLKQLEQYAYNVVGCDWRLHIHDEVASDIRKYRSYKGESIRDLLRALRNKKHHFRELTTEAQQYLGDIPDSFAAYWLDRFPLLLIHTWITMQCVSNEVAFRQYYDDGGGDCGAGDATARQFSSLSPYKYAWAHYDDQMTDYVSRHPIEVDEQRLEAVRKACDTTSTGSAGYGSRSPRARGERKNVGLYRNLDPNDWRLSMIRPRRKASTGARPKRVDEEGEETKTTAGPVWATIEIQGRNTTDNTTDITPTINVQHSHVKQF